MQTQHDTNTHTNTNTTTTCKPRIRCRHYTGMTGASYILVRSVIDPSLMANTLFANWQDLQAKASEATSRAGLERFSDATIVQGAITLGGMQ